MSDYLFEELIVEIFTRLPPKSLIRFGSLSKSWHRLISSSDFINKHTRYAKQSPNKVLIRHLSDGQSFYASHSQDQLPFSGERCFKGIIGFKFVYPGCQVIGSCNGIIYLYHYSSQKPILWNPSIRRKLEVPGVRNFRGTGFGFDPITDDYKVVRIPDYQSGQSLLPRGPEVYTIQTGAWSEITSPVPPYHLVTYFGCFFNGAFHWVVEGFNLDHFIVTLDINTYVFSTVELPEPLRHQEECSTKLTIIRESLAVFSWNSDSVSIWVLNGSICALVYKFKNPNPEIPTGIYRVLQMTDNDDFLLSTYYGGFKVNPVTGQQCKLVGFRNNLCCDLETYTESLELLNEGKTFEANEIFNGE